MQFDCMVILLAHIHMGGHIGRRFCSGLKVYEKGIKSPITLFQPRLVQRSEGITFILTSEEEQYRKDERRRKVTIQKKKITVYLSVIPRKEFTTSITVYSLNYLITL